MVRFRVAAVVTALAVGALLLGQLAFVVFVVALAAVALVDLCALLGAGGARPVLPVAAIPGVVLPVLIAVDLDPVTGWERLPGVFAVTVLVGFALVLATRRAAPLNVLGATFAAGLMVGLGASGLLLVRALPDGFRWVGAFGLLAVVADNAGPLTRRVSSRGISGEADLTVDDPATEAPLDSVVATLVAVAVAGAGAFVAIGPPLTPWSTAMIGLVAAVAALGGAYLQRTLEAEAGLHPDHPPARLGGGVVFGVVDALFLGAPAVYVLARATVL